MTTLEQVTSAAAASTAAAWTRDETIRDAHASGLTIRAIAEAAGLSPARVHQIIHGR